MISIEEQTIYMELNTQQLVFDQTNNIQSFSKTKNTIHLIQIQEREE